MHTPARPAAAAEIPVIDLTPLTDGGDISSVAQTIRDACTTTGFFYVANHGIADELINGVFDVTRRYFALPEQQRLPHKMDERFRRGFMPQGINQHPGYDPDIKESYEIGVDLPLDHPSVVAGLPLHGPNRWPSDAPWLRATAEPYFEACRGLGERLLQAFARSLDLEDDYFARHSTNAMVQMRLFHYPAPPADAGDKAFGVAPHTDYGMITLLLQDPNGGLEVRKRDGEWIAASHVPGTLVINIGDLFQRWTNDVYVSNPHRVINRTGRDRYSIPMFYNLDWDTPIDCLPTCQSADKPPKYEMIRSGDYLLSRFRDVQKYKAELAAK